MWYTVLRDDVPIGFVELASGALVAAPMLRLSECETIGPVIRLATHDVVLVAGFGRASATVGAVLPRGPMDDAAAGHD